MDYRINVSWWSIMALLVAIMAVSPQYLVADTPVVRILFYTGNVQVAAGGGTAKATLGQQLSQGDKVIIGNGATLQLSINGKVLKYNSPMTLTVTDAIKRAEKGESSVVAQTARTIAGASGAGRGKRSSVAGATRLDDSSNVVASNEDEVVTTTGDRINDEIYDRTGIEDPLGTIGEAMTTIKGDALIPIEPRNTNVSGGTLHFRWKHTPGVERYVVIMKDYLDTELFRANTSDTTVTWEGADTALHGDLYYTWELINADNPFNTTTASFTRVSTVDADEIASAINELQNELGDDNPALPLLLGALYEDYDCYGQAARYYTQVATESPEHIEKMLGIVRDLYVLDMHFPKQEVEAICGSN